MATTLTASAVRLYQAGGPELLQVESVDVPPPGPGEVRLRQTACGLNYIDVYDRTGLYPAPFPLTPKYCTRNTEISARASVKFRSADGERKKGTTK